MSFFSLNGKTKNSANELAQLPDGCPRVIAVVTDALYPFFMGGKEVLYHNVTAGLAEEGIEVHVYSMHWWEGPRNKVEDDIHYHALCRVYALYADARRSILEAVMFALACLRLLGRHYDLIYADHMPHLQIFTIRLVATFRRVPLVVTWHEVWGRDYWREYLGFAGIIAAFIERATMRLPDHIVAVSAETAENLRSNGVRRDRITIIPNGVAVSTIASVTPAAQHYDFVYVGRLLQHKRAEQLINGIAALRAEGILATCVIIGEGPEHENLANLCGRLGLGKDVTFISKLPNHSDVFSLMKAATALVLPSVREGFGIVVAEALACGLPVITTNHPENHAQDLVEDGVSGWLCPPTSEGIVVAMRDAMTGGAAHRQPSPELSQRYDWHSVVRNLIDVFTFTSADRAG